MKLPAYPRTKPSGIEWLGDVPEHWEVKRLKTSATCWVSNVDKVPAEDELPVRLCNYTDVYYHDHITPDMELMETTATADEIQRFGLRVGDVVITKDSEEWSDIAVPALVKKSAPDLVCGYHLAIIRSHADKLFGDYLLRAFQSCAVNQQFQIAASGVTRYGLPKSSIGDAWIPLPEPAEQQTIASFLDRETGRVDRLVAKKRELIERLEEKRTALISRTVTRGLPPAAGLPANPPLKPSGVDWLGDIPAHWETMMLKRTWAVCEYGISESLSGEGSIRVLTMGNIHDGRVLIPNEGCLDGVPSKMLLKDGDLLFNRTNSMAHVGKVGIFRPHSDAPVTFASYLVRLRTNDRAMPEFMNYLLNTSQVLELGHSLALPSINQANLNPTRYGQISIPLPPLPEQVAIAAHLDVETAKLDALVGKVEEAVERLQEYRTALITAAVTGKIDVRKEPHACASI